MRIETLSRRGFVLGVGAAGTGALLAMPAVVRAASLMPVRLPDLLRNTLIYYDCSAAPWEMAAVIYPDALVIGETVETLMRASRRMSSILLSGSPRLLLPWQRA